MHKDGLARGHTTGAEHHGRTLKGWAGADNHRLRRERLLRDDGHDGGGGLTVVHVDSVLLGTLCGRDWLAPMFIQTEGRRASKQTREYGGLAGCDASHSNDAWSNDVLVALVA